MITLDTLVKWTDAEGRSCHGGRGRWRVGRWREVTGPLKTCKRGLHVVSVRQSLSWVTARVGIVEVAGERLDDADKSVARRARITQWLPWDIRSVRLWAADCAEHVLPIWEASRPGDERPRQAIEVARGLARGQVVGVAAAAPTTPFYAADAPAYAAAPAAPAYAAYAAYAAAAYAYAAVAPAAADAAATAAAYATSAFASAAYYSAVAADSAAETAYYAAGAAYYAAGAAYAASAAERGWQAERLLAYLRGEP